MIREGDRVYPWMRMNMHGKVIKIKEVPINTWMVGGALQKKITAVVQHDDGTLVEYQLQDLMKSD